MILMLFIMSSNLQISTAFKSPSRDLKFLRKGLVVFENIAFFPQLIYQEIGLLWRHYRCVIYIF